MIDPIEDVWEKLGVETVVSRDFELVCEESVDKVVVLPEGETKGGMAKEMIFIPLLVLVLAGIKRVLALLGPGMETRLGWFELAHPVFSCVPVEYSWRASARWS